VPLARIFIPLSRRRGLVGDRPRFARFFGFDAVLCAFARPNHNWFGQDRGAPVTPASLQRTFLISLSCFGTASPSYTVAIAYRESGNNRMDLAEREGNPCLSRRNRQTRPEATAAHRVTLARYMFLLLALREASKSNSSRLLPLSIKPPQPCLVR